jgi:hypothetical protein
VLGHSGLRGAFSLTLVLIVDGSEDIDPLLRERFTFLVAGTIVLTVLVQGGLTSRLLAEALQLGRGTAAEQTAFDIACAELENCLQEEAQRLKRNEPLLAGALHSTPNNIVLLPDPFIQIAGNHVVVSLHAL